MQLFIKSNWSFLTAPEEITAAACDDKKDRLAMARHYNEVTKFGLFFLIV